MNSSSRITAKVLEAIWAEADACGEDEIIKAIFDFIYFVDRGGDILTEVVGDGKAVDIDEYNDKVAVIRDLDSEVDCLTEQIADLEAEED